MYDIFINFWTLLFNFSTDMINSLDYIVISFGLNGLKSFIFDLNFGHSIFSFDLYHFLVFGVVALIFIFIFRFLKFIFGIPADIVRGLF